MAMMMILMITSRKHSLAGAINNFLCTLCGWWVIVALASVGPNRAKDTQRRSFKAISAFLGRKLGKKEREPFLSLVTFH